MEIYQETLYDLFNNRSKVEMQSGGASGLRFQGLKEHPVRSEEEVDMLVSKGMEGKTMGANYRHEHSSRSHTVVRLIVESHHETDEALQGVISGSLMLIDLAGSETVHENTDARATAEGKAIIKSLFHLRNCVHALSSSKRPDFRSSKLTRLLEPSIRNGCVSLICNTPQAITNIRQIVDALEFGQLTQNVKLTPTQNKVVGDSEFHKLKAMMDAQLAEAQALQHSVQEELAQTHEDYGRQIAELQSRVVTADTLAQEVESLRVEKEEAELRTAQALEEKESLQAKLNAMVADTKATLAELDAKERSGQQRESALLAAQEQYEALSAERSRAQQRLAAMCAPLMCTPAHRKLWLLETRGWGQGARRCGEGAGAPGAWQRERRAGIGAGGDRGTARDGAGAGGGDEPRARRQRERECEAGRGAGRDGRRAGAAARFVASPPLCLFLPRYRSFRPCAACGSDPKKVCRRCDVCPVSSDC